MVSRELCDALLRWIALKVTSYYLASRGLSWWGAGTSGRSWGLFGRRRNQAGPGGADVKGEERAVRWVGRGVSLQPDFMTL